MDDRRFPTTVVEVHTQRELPSGEDTRAEARSDGEYTDLFRSPMTLMRCVPNSDSDESDGVGHGVGIEAVAVERAHHVTRMKRAKVAPDSLPEGSMEYCPAA